MMSSAYRIVLASMLATACSSPRPIHTSRDRNNNLHVSGPLEGTGPFASVEEAELAACHMIMSQPGSTAFNNDGDGATEHCAVIYKSRRGIELSNLSFSLVQIDKGKRTCPVPVIVDDVNRPTEQVLYLELVHSHPWKTGLSEADVKAAISLAKLHGRTQRIGNVEIPLAVILFWPGCEVMLKYTPVDNTVYRFEKRTGRWESIGTANPQTGAVYLK